MHALIRFCLPLARVVRYYLPLARWVYYRHLIFQNRSLA